VCYSQAVLERQVQKTKNKHHQIYKKQKEIIKMKNIENMTKLNDMVLAEVAGGDDDRTIVDDFVDWLLSPIEYALNNVVSDDRPLPFPQDRRGNKAPLRYEA
jgi:hypothetical protein